MGCRSLTIRTEVTSCAAREGAAEGELAANTESPGDEKKQQKSRGPVEAREVRPGAASMWLKKSVQAQSLEDHLDLEMRQEGINDPAFPPALRVKGASA